MQELVFGRCARADEVLVHVPEDLPDAHRLPADELLEVVGEGCHLTQADGPAEAHHAIRAEREVLCGVCPHVLGGARNADGIEEGVLLLVVDVAIVTFLPVTSDAIAG